MSRYFGPLRNPVSFGKTHNRIGIPEAFFERLHCLVEVFCLGVDLSGGCINIHRIEEIDLGETCEI
jgi:hypothetical protein